MNELLEKSNYESYYHWNHSGFHHHGSTINSITMPPML
jgi:hypothetical protein